MDTNAMTPAEREATYSSWAAVGKSKIIKCDDDKTAHAIGNWILKQVHCAGVGWDTYSGHLVMLDNEAQFIESAIVALRRGLERLTSKERAASTDEFARVVISKL